MNINELVKKSSRQSRIFLSQNSTVILTAVGVTGTITTAFLTGRASFKAAELIRNERLSRLNESDEGVVLRDIQLDRNEKIKLVAPSYVPAVGVMLVTIAAIIMANRLGSKKAAALAAAYGISERAFTEYREKIIEKIGEKKELEYRDEIAQNRVDANPVTTREVIITGAGEVLCYDALTGRYFLSTVEKIRQSQNKVNADIINHMYASLSSFYEEIGLTPTAYSDDVGWNTDHLLEVSFSTTLSADNRPCLVLDFQVGPKHNYNGEFYS